MNRVSQGLSSYLTQDPSLSLLPPEGSSSSFSGQGGEVGDIDGMNKYWFL